MRNLLIVLLGTCFLSACAASIPVEQTGKGSEPRPYFSEIDHPEAKAWYAYAQFRMLILEDRWDEGIKALERALAFDPDSAKLGMTLAKAYLRNRQLEKSGRQLEKLLESYPQRYDGWELLGQLRTYQQRYPQALRAYRKALDISPLNETLQLRLVAVYEELGDLPAALAATRRFLERSPDSLRGRLALARLQSSNRQVQQAIKTYRELLAQRPGQLQVILEMGQLLEKEEQAAEAIDLYRKSIRDNPQLLPVYKQLARILILQERYEEALQFLEEARRQQPEDVQILTRIGLLHLSRNNFKAGEKAFRQILALQPGSPQHLYSLGMALIGQQRNDEALTAFAAIPRDSDIYPGAVVQIGYLYRQEGDLERGIRVLEAAVGQGADSVELYTYLSAFLGEAERFAVAAKVVRQGLEIFPREAGLHYQLGILSERLDDRAQALQQMEKVLDLEPRNADALNFIAYNLAERGENLEQALVQAQLALEQKKTAYIFDTLGWIYYRMQRFDEARANLEKALLLDDEDPLIQEHLGDTYVKLERWRDAEKAYRRVLELDKDSGEAAQKLKTLLKDHSP